MDCKLTFQPGLCVVDVAVIIPRFDASVHVTYSSVFVLPSDISAAVERRASV